MSNIEDNGRVMAFRAINKNIAVNITLPTERITGKDYVEWGDSNKYPEYLLSLYNSVPTLRSIINGNIDYIAGDDTTLIPFGTMAEGEVNITGETIREQVREVAKDIEIYGGFALQVIRNHFGAVSEIYHIDMRFLRTNKECDTFFYCEDWLKGKDKLLVYPKYLPNLDWNSLDDESKNRHASSILFVKNVRTQVYPAPLYAASVKACEIERKIDEFHLNTLENQFTSSAIVNFNNGVPDEDLQKEIENNFNEKFSGSENAGRILFSWNRDGDSRTTIEEFKIEDFGERYEALEKHSRQQIFTAFRANPNLFGIPTEGNGFSNEEYAESFKLYNRTQIRPSQHMIVEAYEKILGRGCMQITPFSIDGINNVD